MGFVLKSALAIIGGASCFPIVGCAMTGQKPTPLDQYNQVMKMAEKGKQVDPTLDYLTKSRIPYTDLSDNKRIVLTIHNTDRGAVTTESISVEIEYNEQRAITSVTSKKQYTGP